MASTSDTSRLQPVVFTTQTPYPIPTQKFMIPSVWKRYQLSQLINKSLSLPKHTPFDFIVRGEILRSSLAEWCAEKGIGEEETLEIEYIESVMPPQRMSGLPHEDWVSSVSCQLRGYFLTASYDGHIRAFDYSQNLITNSFIHPAPITSICIVPSLSSPSHRSSDSSTHIIASASHDLTAQLTQISLSPGPNIDGDTAPASRDVPLATMHLHTGPLSSISASPTGSHLLSSSWDGLIGLWDTSIPSHDEVPAEQVEVNDRDRKKRRKIADEGRPKRKAPVTVLKSHTTRVSKVVFGSTGDGTGDGKVAYSCGFDSTVRTWDVESGVCTNTITASEKPFLDLALTADGHTALAASTDRTITLYDIRDASRSTISTTSLLHSSTPSCIAPSPSTSSSHQVMSGAYNGVVLLWDLRSVKSAMVSFKPWDGGKKVLSIDWRGGLVGVGGEGGFEVWKVGEEGVPQRNSS